MQKTYTDVDGAVRWFREQGLPMSKPTLNRWRVSGQGPQYVKIGQRVAYPVDALAEFVAGRLRTATTDARA